MTISYLTDNSELGMQSTDKLITDFEAANPNITVEHETYPAGAEDVLKTRIATGDMTDVFGFHAGSALLQINPRKTLVPLTGEPFLADVHDSFQRTVTVDGDVYGVPIGTAMGFGLLYNTKVYSDLGLEIPTTWDEFIENNEKIEAAGIVPIIQTYGDPWTAQLIVLASNYNLMAIDPEFPEKWTANQANFSSEPAIRGFQHLEQAYEAGYFNEDFASAKLDDGLRMIAQGAGAHYPMISGVVAGMVGTYPDSATDVGFFAMPGDDQSKTGLITHVPGGLYISKTAEGDRLEAAKKFLAFIASPAGCDALTELAPPSGPYMVTGCELPAELPQATQDLLPYFEVGGSSAPNLALLSPLSGPSLDKICVEVGSGIRSAEEGAKLFDEDVKKQAEQLGLPGW